MTSLVILGRREGERVRFLAGAAGLPVQEGPIARVARFTF